MTTLDRPIDIPSKKFAWGKVLDRITYDFDGATMEVIKFHPWKTDGCSILTGQVDETKTEYQCDELHESSENIYALILSFMADKHLGQNQHTLVAGIARSLCLKGYSKIDDGTNEWGRR